MTVEHADHVLLVNFDTCGHAPYPLEVDPEHEKTDRREDLILGRCRRPAAYLARSNKHDSVGALCPEHAALARSCPHCAQHVAAMWSA